MTAFQKEYKDRKTGKLVTAKTWTCVYYEPRPDGRRTQRWKGGFKTKRDALAFEVEQRERINKGTYSRPKKVLLGAFLTDEFLPSVKVSRRTSTWELYEMYSRVHVIPALGGYELTAISPGALDQLYAQLLGKGLSKKYVHNIHSMIHRALTVARKRGLVPVNVADDANPPSPATREMEYWKPDEMRAFLAATADDRMHAAFRLTLATGMRRGEVLGLKWSEHIDLDAGTVAIREARVKVRGGWETVKPKTDKGRRTLRLDPGTLLALRAWRKRQLAERMLIGERYEDSGYVFTKPDGSPPPPNRLSIWFRATVERLGMRRVRLHDLRHTYVTVARAEGTPLHAISARVGHANPSITSNIYAHVLPEDDVAAAETIGAALDRPVSRTLAPGGSA